MKATQSWRWGPVVVVLLAMIGTMGRADDLAITPSKKVSNLVFRTPDNGTTAHWYRVEYTTALVSAAWTAVHTASGFGVAVSVTNGVATSNSATLVDGRYMAVDVSEGPSTTNYPVTYYDTLADVPGGDNSCAYKTANLLMRLIPKGVFIIGSTTTELWRYTDEAQHQFTLTQDFSQRLRIHGV